MKRTYLTICIILTVCVIFGVLLFIRKGNNNEKTNTVDPKIEIDVNYTFDGAEIDSNYEIYYSIDDFKYKRTLSENKDIEFSYNENIIQTGIDIPEGVVLEFSSDKAVEESICYIVPYSYVVDNEEKPIISFFYGFNEQLHYFPLYKSIKELYIPDQSQCEAYDFYLNNLEVIHIGNIGYLSMSISGENLQKIVFSPHGEYLFAPTIVECPSLEEISLPDSIKYMMNSIDNCDALTSLKIPESLEIMETGCVIDCDNLEQIELNEKLKFIGDYCFRDLPLVKEIKIPDSVTHIGEGCFVNCENLNLVVAEGSVAEAYAEENGITYKVE